MAKKIVIVDDEKDLVTVTKMRLEANGFLVYQAFTAKSGLEIVGQENPDLVILDILLPDGNGYQVCQKLKSDPKTKDIPVIMFTASSLKGLAHKAVEAGAQSYIVKPYEAKELLEKVNRALEKK